MDGLLAVSAIFGFPILIGIVIGWREGGVLIETPVALFKAALWALAWSITLIAVFHGVWIAGLGVAAQMGVALWMSVLYWVTISGLIWIPAMMIALMVRAQRVRKA